MAAHSQPPRVAFPLQLSRPALLIVSLCQRSHISHLRVPPHVRPRLPLVVLNLSPRHPGRRFSTFACLFALLGLAFLLLLLSRRLKRLSLSLLRRTASFLSHSQCILYFVLLLLLLQVIVTVSLAAVMRKVFVLCSVASGEGEASRICEAWLLPLASQLDNPPLLLLSVLLLLWAFLVLSMLISLLVAALMGHGVTAEEGDHGTASRVDSTSWKFLLKMLLLLPTLQSRSFLPATPPPIAPSPRDPRALHSLCGLVLTRSLGTAAAVAMLLIVLYILFTALNTWLVVYVFASLEVPGLLTGSAAALLTVAELVLMHVFTW
ncbi:unnamed protein product [Closterium sp. Naga37s-1]|nr:unnamed protein product [Closterium sp. Naga37s-1]